MTPTPLLTRTRHVLLFLALTLGLLSLPAGAATIDDGVATLVVSDTHGGATDYIRDGADHLFQADYYYRTPSMTQEGRMTGFGSSLVSSVVADDVANEITVQGSLSGVFDFTLTYSLSGSGLLVPSLDIVNLDTVNPLDLTLFSYHDWDVDGSFNGDSVSWNGVDMVQSDSTILSIRPFTTPDAVEAGPFNPPGPSSSNPSIRDRLRDGDVDDLVDGAGLPFGPGDGTFAFQYLLSLAPGATTTIIYSVPEPSTGALAALGLIGLAWVGRDRRRTR